MEYDVFISYSRKDLKQVTAIKTAIEKAIPDIKIWFDLTGVESGELFEQKIIKAIESSDIVLFVISESSMASENTKHEVMYAYNKNKRVIPLLLDCDRLPDGWFLFKFGSIDYIVWSDEAQRAKLIRDLENSSAKNGEARKNKEEIAKERERLEKESKMIEQQINELQENLNRLHKKIQAHDDIDEEKDAPPHEDKPTLSTKTKPSKTNEDDNHEDQATLKKILGAASSLANLPSAGVWAASTTSRGLLAIAAALKKYWLFIIIAIIVLASICIFIFGGKSCSRDEIGNHEYAESLEYPEDKEQDVVAEVDSYSYLPDILDCLVLCEDKNGNIHFVDSMRSGYDPVNNKLGFKIVYTSGGYTGLARLSVSVKGNGLDTVYTAENLIFVYETPYGFNDTTEMIFSKDLYINSPYYRQIVSAAEQIERDYEWTPGSYHIELKLGGSDEYTKYTKWFIIYPKRERLPYFMGQ